MEFLWGLLSAPFKLFADHLFKQYANRPNLKIRMVHDSSLSGPLRPNEESPRDEKGHYIIHYGDDLPWTYEITWSYRLEIVNKSSEIAYDMELYIPDKFRDITFTGDLNTPLREAQSIHIVVKYVKRVESSYKKRAAEQEKFPSEIKNGFKVVLRYSSQYDKVFYTKFELKNGEQVNTRIRRIPKGFSRVQVYPTPFAVV